VSVQKSAGPAELEARRKVGLAGAALVGPGMVVGLGTGSTAAFAIEELGRRVREEKLAITGVPTSWSAAELARKSGIPVRALNDVAQLDLALDGADEVGPELALIKGGGKDGPVVTDHGNLVVDAKFAGIDDPAALARAIDAIPGVVEHGLFVGLADEALVGSAGGSVRTLRGVRAAR